MSDDSPVAHEGNPKLDLLTIEGGNLLTTATLGIVLPFVEPPVIIPPETPPPPTGECPDCIPLILSVAGANAATQALCASDTGDGCVVTCPSDYSFDPAYYDEACENYYGAFRFGLNASYFGDFPPAAYWTTTPSLWIAPAGVIVLNSSCASRVSKQLAFDFHASLFGDSVNYTSVTPATFQTQVIDNWNSTGAHGARPPATPDGATNADVTDGGYLDCRFLFAASGSSYWSEVLATYEADHHNPVTGVAMLTDDATGPKITGYGILINRFSGTVETVNWADAAPNGYSVLASQAYEPLQGDQLELRIVQECPCPYGDASASSIHPAYPKGGYVWALLNPETGPSATTLYAGARPSFGDVVGSLAPAEFQSLGYGCLLALSVDNGFCDNYAVWRTPTVTFHAAAGACSGV